MKLLLDQGLPRSTVKHLAAAGIVAEHVGDLGMATADDDAILDSARQRQAVVVTLIHDFIDGRGSCMADFKLGPGFLHLTNELRAAAICKATTKDF